MVRLFAFIVALYAAQSSLGQPTIYRNTEFGITLSVPHGLRLCRAPSTQHDHGPVLLLDPEVSASCEASADRREIEVLATYNTTDTSKTLPLLLSFACSDAVANSAATKPNCAPAPTGLGIPQVATASGRRDREGGWIDVIVVAQAGEPDPSWDKSVPRVNYILTLTTEREHFDADVRVFRTVLQTISLSPPRERQSNGHSHPGSIRGR
jgi:hypothetical protein